MEDESYLVGLDHEREGYEARIRKAEDDGDEAAVKRYNRRIGEVDAEIARVGNEGESPVGVGEPETTDLGGAPEQAVTRSGARPRKATASRRSGA